MTTKKEWDKENMTTLACRMRKGEAEQFKLFCATHDTTVHSLLTWAVRGLMSGELRTENFDRVKKLEAENRQLQQKLAVAVEDREIAMNRAKRAEDLVDLWLRSADAPKKDAASEQ